MKNSSDLSRNIARQEASSRAAVEDAIARRARELYQLRGCVDGHALEDWLQAEKEVLARLAAQAKSSTEKPADQQRTQPLGSPVPVAKRSAFFKVKVDGVLYTVEYDPQDCDSYRPGMLRKGEPVQLRFEEDKVYLQLPNHTELEAKVVKKGGA